MNLSPSYPQFRRIIFQNQGSTLIELLIAATITVIVMTAIAISLMYSIQREAENRYQESAVLMAQNALDMLLTERAELGWEAFSTKFTLADYCVNKNSNTNQDELILKNTNLCPNLVFGGLGFTAVVESEIINSTQIKSIVRVNWNAGSEMNKEYELTQNIYRGVY